jgi:hypothetical protein
VLHNEFRLLFLVNFDSRGRSMLVKGVPFALDYGHTRLAAPEEAAWIADRFQRVCTAPGTEAEKTCGRLVVDRTPPMRRTPIARSGGDPMTGARRRRSGTVAWVELHPTVTPQRDGP